MPVACSADPTTLLIGNISVQVVRKNVRNMNLRIRRDGTVSVSVPLTVSDRVVVKFLKDRAEWIATHRAQVLSQMTARSLASDLTPSDEKELRAQLHTRLTEFVLLWEQRMNVHCTSWQIRKMQTRWGSCSVQSGRIRFAFALAFVPDDQLEYVVVHELCHLRESGHGERFKALMTSYLPDWKSRRARLHH
jgi:predicted metal-dependent hydrolase